MSRMETFTQELSYLDRARYSVIYLVTSEERRAELALADLARERDKRFITWTITEGFKSADPGDQQLGKIEDPTDALNHIIAYGGPAYFMLKDFDAYFAENPIVQRRLRDAADDLRGTKKTIFLTSPRLTVPPTLDKVLHVLDFPLPDMEELGSILDTVIEKTREQLKLKLENGQREAVLKAALGLTWDEASNVFAKSLVAKRTFDPQMIIHEKQQIIRKSEVLEYTPAAETLKDVGGLDALKGWLVQAGTSHSEKARSFGVDPVRSVLIIGVPGTGKSLTAKAVAHAWGWPLVRADLGRLFGGIVGDTERNTRRMTQLAEAIAPVVLWMDEVEKGLGGIESSGATSGGVELRLFGHLLTWMQECTAPVFIVATANDVRQLRPEFLRRFRHIFFADQPTNDELKEIWTIHLTKRKRTAASFDLDTLVVKTIGFTGAEVEKVVQEALLLAFSRNEPLSDLHLLWAVGTIVPITKTMKEQLTELRTWVSQGRARPATTPIEKTAAGRELEL